MMEFIPEKIQNAVIFSARQVCGFNELDCNLCADFAVSVHNWLMEHEVPYLVLDLQDEKDVCPELLMELLQLRKRLKFPFYFAGVLDKARKILLAHGFSNADSIFSTPEEAVADLFSKFPAYSHKTFDSVQFGQPLAVSKPRQGVRIDGAIVEGEAEVEAEVEE